MLSAEENELLTHTGPGSPMGALFRRYWLPALLSEELSEPDGAPVPVDILGERLVAFRDTSGHVGLVEERCAHRGASLLYARNEEGGLRCIFHGWKYDAAGRCLDMPTEPDQSPAKPLVRLRAYPAREAGGVVWAYLGPSEKQPPFPQFSWLTLPLEQCRVFKILQECNYAQALERDIDPAHIPIAHRRLTAEQVRAGARLADLDRRETVPRVEVEDTRHGFRYAALRPRDASTEHVRMTSYVMPCYLILGPTPGGNRVSMGVVPRDDHTNWHFLFRFNPEGPADIHEYMESRGLYRIDINRRKVQNLDNKHGQGRQAMRHWNFTGIEGVIIEDHALAEIQGPITDRTREHLGPTDNAIVTLRRTLLAAVQTVAEGRDAPGLDASIPFERITGADFLKPVEVPWREAFPLDPGLSLADGPSAISLQPSGPRLRELTTDS